MKRMILRAIGNVVVTCLAFVGAVIFIAVVAWQNRGRQKRNNIIQSPLWNENELE